VTRGRDAALYAGGLLFQQAVAFLVGVAVARWLGPQGYGQVSLARSIYGVAVIVAPLGLDLSLLRHLGETDAPWPDKLAEVGRLRALALCSSLAALGLAIWIGPWLEAGLYRQPGFAAALRVSFLGLPFAADLAILTALARARGRVGVASLCALYLQPLARTAALLLLLQARAGPLGVLGATAAGLAAADLALGAALLERGRGPRRLAPARRPARRGAPGRLLGYSLWMAGALLAYNGLKLTDVLVLGWARPAREVGDYAALSAIAQLVGLYPTALSQTLAPAVARLNAAGDRAGVRRELRGYVRRAGLAGAPLFAGVAVFGPWLDLLFGRRFHFDGRLSLLLALAAYVSGVFGPLSASLSMTGRHRLELAILAGGGLCSLIACLLLAPAFGGVGVAVGSLGGYLAINALRAWASARVLGGTDLAAADLLAPFSCLMLAWVWRALAEGLGRHDLLTAAWVGAGFCGSLAVLYVGGLLGPEEKAALARLSRPRWRSGAAAAPCRS
jgi:O-antigen/teichoic acid export membrane protein